MISRLVFLVSCVGLAWVSYKDYTREKPVAPPTVPIVIKGDCVCPTADYEPPYEDCKGLWEYIYYHCPPRR